MKNDDQVDDDPERGWEHYVSREGGSDRTEEQARSVARNLWLRHKFPVTGRPDAEMTECQPTLVISGPSSAMFVVETLEGKLQAELSRLTRSESCDRSGLHRALCIVVQFKNLLGGVGIPPLPQVEHDEDD